MQCRGVALRALLARPMTYVADGESQNRQWNYELQHNGAEGWQGIVLLGIERYIGGVGSVIEQKKRALPASYGVAGEKDRRASQRDSEHYRHVEGQERRRDFDSIRGNQAAQSENRKQIEDTAADGISHCNVALAAQAGDKGASSGIDVLQPRLSGR